MSIVVNGTALKSATFNEQDVDSIYYNGSLVWERPPEIQLISGIQSDGTAWIKTDFGTEDFTYTSGSSTRIDGYIEYEFTPLNKLSSKSREYRVFDNKNSNINSRFHGILRTDSYSSSNPLAFTTRFGRSYISVVGTPLYVNNKYNIAFNGISNSYAYFYTKVYDSEGKLVKSYSNSSADTADATPTSDKFVLFSGGDEEIRQNVIFHSFTFGGSKSVENELQRILQPAIMKRKGVETVGLYDAKRDIFYGPQEGSFIPHY